MNKIKQVTQIGLGLGVRGLFSIYLWTKAIKIQ